MPHLAHRTFRGLYQDSLVLMQLQTALLERPGVEEAAAVMGTGANRELLAERGLLPEELSDAGEGAARADDLVVAVRAASAAEAAAALERVPELLAARRSGGTGGDGTGGAGGAESYRPRSLGAAFRALPAARWVLVSVPGRWAGGVARDALAAGRHVFLYSDNVPVAEEAALKAEAAGRGLLVLGPDCGTAIVGGAGLGFANRVPAGGVGIVAASGTGLQAVVAGLAGRGAGVSHALGTGGRDLSAEVGGATALAAFALLARDPGTRVVVLVSKPPAPEVAARLLAAARGVAAAGKPVVVWLLGAAPPARRVGRLHFAAGADDAAELAAGLAGRDGTAEAARAPAAANGGSAAAAGPPRGHLRGLFSGGTLAAEALHALRPFLGTIASNLLGGDGDGDGAGHRLLDLGADEHTRGRPHPMLDPAPVAERLRAAGDDPDTGLVLFDVVLGDGAHPDPAAVLAPALEAARAAAREAGREAGRELRAVALLVGTPDDPQDREAQAERLAAAGAQVVATVPEAAERALAALAPAPAAAADTPPVPSDALARPLAAVNVGLETFHASLLAQGHEAIHVDWRPPAGGDERLAGILERIKRESRKETR